MVIFQILPSHKSCVYGWMKQLPYEIGRIRQGISVENALTMFDGLNLQEVIRMSGVENVENLILVDNEWALSTVKVVGYPNNYNQYQLAAIFYNFHIVHIHFEGDSAVVSFINKFHAAQAVMTFDGFKLDSNHVLSVTPLSDIVKEQVNLV
uniref:RRM domain-containing protein n=1 Tax=Syphacia muris TaxID=451379 RepID=A0A0N5A8W1_9BILA